ncbi:hypothetical protein ACOME3_003226 [Neoechinorhynchus agilis]
MIAEIKEANRCIELLKRHNAGRTTIIALDQQKSKWQNVMSRPFNCPMIDNGVERIFDILQVSHPDILPVFYHVFRDTLMCPLLNIADRVAFQGSKRFRVVTYQGHLFETSGTVTGGGQPRRGKILTSSGAGPKLMDAKDFSSLENRISLLRAEVEDIRSSVEEMENDQSGLSVKWEELKSELGRVKVELETQRNLLPNKKRELLFLASKRDELIQQRNKLKHYDAEIEQLKKEFDSIAQVYNAAKESADQLKHELESKTEAIVSDAKRELVLAEDEALREKKRFESLQVVLKLIPKQKLTIEKRIGDRISERDKLIQLNKRLNKEIENLSQMSTELEEERKTVELRCSELNNQMHQLENECRKIFEEISRFENQNIDNREKCTRLGKKVDEMNVVRKRIFEHLNGLVFHKIEEEEDDDPDDKVDKEEVHDDDLKKKINELKSQLKNAMPNLGVVKIYRQKRAVFKKRVAEANVLNQRLELVLQKLLTLKNRRLDEFTKCLNMISANLRNIFRQLTIGGDAELEMVDSSDPFSEGIDFSVRPQKKSWKKIANISGGEKTLSSLSLIFALHLFKRTPLYFMDEIDAALDFRNVTIIRNYVKECTKNAQFVVVSLRQQMFHGANRVTGVSKMDGISHTVTCINNVLIIKTKRKTNRTIFKRKITKDDDGDENEGSCAKQSASDTACEVKSER